MYEWQKKAAFAKPCPFCGSKNVLTEKKEHFYSGNVRTVSYIVCGDCGAQLYGNPILKEDATYNKAQHIVLKMWNRRTVA